MERCPNCRARIECTPDSCRRCGMDLALLQAVEQAAEQQLRAALADLARGDQDKAALTIKRALLLRRTPLAMRVARYIAIRRTPIC
jgi:hypothetical protein